MDICRCLAPDRTWHKVNDYSGDLGKGKVGNEPRLEPYWSVLLIHPLSAMWVQWAKQFHESKSGSGHVCRVIAWTRQQSLVLYIGDRGCSWPTKAEGLSTSNLPLISIPHPARMPDGPAKVREVFDKVWYLSLPPTRQDLTQGQKPESRLKWG